jgi:hypothetical protein
MPAASGAMAAKCRLAGRGDDAGAVAVGIRAFYVQVIQVNQVI